MPTAAASITREHVEMFVQDQLARHKLASAATRYRALQGYFRWLEGEGEIRESPMLRIRPPKVPENLPEVISEDSIRKLLKVGVGSGFDARRDTTNLGSPLVQKVPEADLSEGHDRRPRVRLAGGSWALGELRFGSISR
jgi:integrase